MYVLYPTEDGEVFCRGAVLPYYEFRSPARLDDRQWKALLDLSDPPEPAFQRATFLSAASQSAAEEAASRQAWWMKLAIGIAVAAAVCLALRRWIRRRATA